MPFQANKRILLNGVHNQINFSWCDSKVFVIVQSKALCVSGVFSALFKMYDMSHITNYMQYAAYEFPDYMDKIY